MRATGWLLLFSVFLARPADATCAPVPPRFEVLEATASRPLSIRWNLGGACCSGGGARQSCNTPAATAGCYPLQQLDELGALVPQPCLELRVGTDPSTLVATRTLAPGAWLLQGNGFVVASEDPARAPVVLERTGDRSASVAVGLATRGQELAVAWASAGGPLELRLFGPARERTQHLGTLDVGRVRDVGVVPFRGGWLVGAADRVVTVRPDGSTQVARLQGELEALAAHGAGARVVVRTFDGGVSLLDLDERGRAVGAGRALPLATRWELLPLDGGLIAAGLNGPYPPHLMKVLPDGAVATRGQAWWGFANAQVGRSETGFALYDESRRQEFDADGRPTTEPLPGGLRGPRDGALGLELDARVNAGFARAADAPGPRVLVEGFTQSFREPKVAALGDRTLAVAWASPDGPRLARVTVPAGRGAEDAGVAPPDSSCTDGATEQCGLHPFGRDCRRLVCGRAVLETALAAGEGRLWAAVLEGDRLQTDQRCATVIDWALDGGAPLGPRVRTCMGSPNAQHVALAAAERPLLAVEGARGVEVFTADTQTRVLEVRGARKPVLAGAKKTLLLVEQDLATIDARLVGEAGVTTLFDAPVSALSAAATPRGFVVMAVRPDDRAVVRFVDLRGKAGRPVVLEGTSGWLVPGPTVTRVFYSGDGVVEQTFSELGVPSASRPQVTPAYPTPVVVSGERFLLTPWSDEHTVELRHLARDGGP